MPIWQIFALSVHPGGNRRQENTYVDEFNNRFATLYLSYPFLYIFICRYRLHATENSSQFVDFLPRKKYD
jgi:hypothetical protein